MNCMLPKGGAGNFALLTSAALSKFNLELARHLKASTGRKIFLYVNSNESVAAHQKYVDENWIDEIINYGNFHEIALNAPSDSAAIFARARQMEDEFDCQYNWLLMARRDAGRGFALGGFYHPRNEFSRRATYPQLTYALTETLAFWRTEFASRQIGTFITSSNGVKEAAVACRSSGIRYRVLYPTRYKNYYYWAHNEFVEFPRLESVYELAGAKPRPPVDLNMPYDHEVNTRRRFIGDNGVVKLLGKLWRAVKRELYLRASGYRTVETPDFMESILYNWRVYRDGRRLRPPHTLKLQAIRGQTFVFFPLQTEPEFSLQVMSPEYFCQIAAIGSLARDLPAGAILAVKETVWGMGRRPRDFYAQIGEFKNVVILDVMERGLDVVHACSAVATISGSAGIEAALIGKPVILFGRHNVYQFLPHVTLVTKEEELRPALRRALNGEVETDRAQQAGARFAEALMQVSFDMGDFTAFDPSTVTEDIVRKAARELCTGSVAEEVSVLGGGNDICRE
jgi:Capsule polysaccharide biosynthesis protein